MGLSFVRKINIRAFSVPNEATVADTNGPSKHYELLLVSTRLMRAFDCIHSTTECLVAFLLPAAIISPKSVQKQDQNREQKRLTAYRGR